MRLYLDHCCYDDNNKFHFVLLFTSSVCDEQVRLELFNGSSHIPRYILHVVDSPKPRPNKFAIFIVPMRR